MKKSIVHVILAAGEGKRMKSGTVKALHRVCGKPMIEWTLRAIEATTREKPVVVLGHYHEQLTEYLNGRANTVYQQQQLGTGHAVMIARDALSKSQAGYVCVLAGDMPLLSRESLTALCDMTMENDLDAAVLAAEAPDPAGYGRVVLMDGMVQSIVEDKDASPEQKQIRLINASVYCFKKDKLLDSLNKLTTQNAQGEYYLTDCIGILSKDGKVGCCLSSWKDCFGVNDRAQLAQANAIMRRRINERLMLSGVTLIDPQSAYIDSDVEIGQDTIIHPNNVLEGYTRIGENVILYPNNRIVDSIIESGTTVSASVILEAEVGRNSAVGPMAYLRPHTRVGDGCRIGDFVEIKNSSIDDGSKVSHLSYVGDSDVGSRVNIGCGVVFVNYDGKKKHRSTVHDDVFIGCNCNLVSPVEIHDGAYLAAGSTITDDVPEKALCIARARQVNKTGWALKQKEDKSL